MRVQDVMSREVVTCHAEDTFSDVVRKMWEEDCGSVVVVDSNRRAMGMVTDRDICMCVFFEDARPQERTVAHAMAHGVQSCRASDPLERALELMSSRQVRRLPVVDDDDRVIGVIALNDLVRSSDRNGDPAPETFVHAMAEICEPRERDFAEVVGGTLSGGGYRELGLAR